MNIRDLERQFEFDHDRSDFLIQTLLNLGLQSETLGEGLHVAILFKEKGYPDLAGRVFKRLRSKWGNNGILRFEYIQYLRRFGEEREADIELVGVLEEDIGGDHILRECIVRALVEHPDDASHITLITRLLHLLSENQSPYLWAVANYFTSFAAKKNLRLKSSNVDNIDQIFHSCRTAFSSRTPFCLLRLGDGEGAFLHAAPYPCSQEALFLNHRQFFSSRWYGDATLASDPLFLEAAAELRSRLVEADIIGIPDRGWLEHEIKMRNLRSIINCIEILRIMDTIGEDVFNKATSTSIAVDLEFRGMITQLLSIAKSVTLITSHANLGHKLEKAGRVKVRETILIPPAYSDAPHTGYAIEKSHFRDAFIKAQDKIANLPPGEVVLVSAGFLGKLYALQVKRNGGIALDIGSLADLWMGYMTRPGFLSLKHLTLS